MSEAQRRGSFRTLGWRILFWMTLVSLGPLLVMAYQGYHCAREAIVDAEETQLKSVLAARVARLSSWRGEVASDFRFMALAPCTLGYCNRPMEDDGPTLAAACCDFLNNVSRRSTIYAAIASFDPDWRPVTHTRSTTAIDPAALPEGFRKSVATTEGLTVSPAVRTDDGTLRTFAGHPITNRGGQVIAFLVAALDLTPIARPALAERRGLGRTGAITLFPTTTEARADLDLAGPVSLIGTEAQVAHYVNRAGDAVVGACAPVDALHSHLLVEVNASEAFAALRTLRWQALLTGAIAFVVVLLLASWISRRLARPLRNLAGAAGRVAAGDPGHRLAPTGDAEAEEVANAFNKMLDQLAESQRHLLHAASLAAVGRLSTSIVHEMRNPLSSIKLNLQALAARVADDDAHRELADIALDQSARLELMLGDLLNYGKPLELRTEALRFADLAADVIEDVRPEAASRTVRIAVHDDLGDTVIAADPEQLRRALSNLIRNAVEASPAGAEVTVRGREADAGVTIEVTDTGPGIPPDNFAHLFQPFFTTRESGTGLGLANARKIAEAHGGSINAENLEPCGARFRLTLPHKGAST